MQVDIQKLKTEGQSYVVSLIETFKDAAWEELRKAKFADLTPEELDIHKTLWSHGFAIGAQATDGLYNGLQEALAKPMK